MKIIKPNSNSLEDFKSKVNYFINKYDLEIKFNNLINPKVQIEGDVEVGYFVEFYVIHKTTKKEFYYIPLEINNIDNNISLDFVRYDAIQIYEIACEEFDLKRDRYFNDFNDMML